MSTPHTTASYVDEETYFTNTHSEKDQSLNNLRLSQAARRGVLLEVAGLETRSGLRTFFCQQSNTFDRVDAANRKVGTGEKIRAIAFFLISKVNGYLGFDRIFLVICFFTILIISAADTWFAVINNNILAAEMNPLCAWLLRIDTDSCGFFIVGKACGVVLTFLTLFMLLRVRYRHARFVIAAITLFQLGLFTHLCLSDPLMDGWINFQLLFEESERSVFSGGFDVHFAPL